MIYMIFGISRISGYEDIKSIEWEGITHNSMFQVSLNNFVVILTQVENFLLIIYCALFRISTGKQIAVKRL